MSVKKKTYTAEFKARVALDAVRGDMTINEITTKYKIHASQVSNWKRGALDFIKNGFSGKQQKIERNDKQLMEQLYRQIGEMKVENDFLKKSVWE
jgi:transposase